MALCCRTLAVHKSKRWKPTNHSRNGWSNKLVNYLLSSEINLNVKCCDWPINDGRRLRGDGQGRHALKLRQLMQGVTDHSCRRADFISTQMGLEGGLCSCKMNSYVCWVDQLTTPQRSGANLSPEFIKSEKVSQTSTGRGCVRGSA